MNDDVLHTVAEQASAAFDGQATADERARLDAAPDGAAAVAFYGELRSQLADVVPPINAREAALSAALGLFDDMHSDASETADDDDAPTDPVAAPRVPSNVVLLAQRRRRQLRWLGSAAAAVAVLAVGAAVVSNSNGSEDKSESVAFAPDDGSNAKTGPPPAQDNVPQTVNETYSIAADSVSEENAAATETTSQEADMSAGAEPVDPATSPGPETFSQTAIADPWFGALRFTSSGQVIAYVESASFGTRSVAGAVPTTAASEATVAEATEETSSDAGSPEGDGGSAGQESPSADADRYAAACVDELTEPYEFAVYRDVDVIIVLTEDGDIELRVPDVSCSVLATITRD